jgi:L-alanine-DL-glutamate epimerase-like enolase superfamily enzyme
LDDQDPSTLIGRNLAELIDPSRGVIEPAAEFLDYPLHDLAARILEVPVYAMLGAAGNKQVRCYSGGTTSTTSTPASRRSGPTSGRTTTSDSATSN